MQWPSSIQSLSIHTQKQSDFDIFNEFIEIDDNNTHGSYTNSKTTNKNSSNDTAIILIAVTTDRRK